MENPHQFYGLLPTKNIHGFLYSVKKETIYKALQQPIMEIIENSEFFKSKLWGSPKHPYFHNKIGISSGSRITDNIGTDIPVAIMDEIQQEIIHGQVRDNYNSIKKRITSRFMLSHGVFHNSNIILVGSAGSSNGFAEELTEEAKKDPTIKILSPSQWDVLGSGKIEYSGKTFQVFVGNDSKEPRMLINRDETDRYLIENHPDLVIDVPIEYYKDFTEDLNMAIRDLAGIVTKSSFAFFGNRVKVTESFTLNTNWFDKEVIEIPLYDTTSRIMDTIDFTRFESRVNRSSYRFIHVDLGIVGDKTGISCYHVSEFREIVRRTKTGELKRSLDPIFHNDFTVGIRKSPGEEVPISKVRDFMFDLEDHGVNIGVVSADGYQSRQLFQELSVRGMNVKYISLDRTPIGYTEFKRAINEDRCKLQNHELLKKELFELIVVAKGKIDHPTYGSKDIADSQAGAMYNALMHYEQYSGFDRIPSSRELAELESYMASGTSNFGSTSGLAGTNTSNKDQFGIGLDDNSVNSQIARLVGSVRGINS